MANKMPPKPPAKAAAKAPAKPSPAMRAKEKGAAGLPVTRSSVTAADRKVNFNVLRPDFESNYKASQKRYDAGTKSNVENNMRNMRELERRANLRMELGKRPKGKPDYSMRSDDGGDREFGVKGVSRLGQRKNGEYSMDYEGRQTAQLSPAERKAYRQSMEVARGDYKYGSSRPSPGEAGTRVGPKIVGPKMVGPKKAGPKVPKGSGSKSGMSKRGPMRPMM